MFSEECKGWAFRSLREAKADLVMAKKSSGPTSIDMILSAMRKAQLAIYHCLGDVMYVESAVHRVISENIPATDPLLKLLVEFERIVKARFSGQAASRKELLREAEFLVDVASEVVKAAVEEEIGSGWFEED